VQVKLVPSLEKLTEDPSAQPAAGSSPHVWEPSGLGSAGRPLAHSGCGEGCSGGTLQALPASSSQIASSAPDSGSAETGQDGGEPVPARAGLDPSSHPGSLPSAHESEPGRADVACEPSSQLGGIRSDPPVPAVRFSAWAPAGRPLLRCSALAGLPCLARACVAPAQTWPPRLWWAAEGQEALRPWAIVGSASSVGRSTRQSAARSSGARRWGRPVVKWISGGEGGRGGGRSGCGTAVVHVIVDAARRREGARGIWTKDATRAPAARARSSRDTNSCSVRSRL
jgi:hypothetical protein